MSAHSVVPKELFPRPTKCFLPTGPVDVHTHHYLIRATLNNGQVFAIDFTGSQYGWFDVIVPWKDYMERIKEIKNDIPMKFMRDKYDHDQGKIHENEGGDGDHRDYYFLCSIGSAEREVVGAIELHLKHWLKENNVDVVGLFQPVTQL